MQANVKAVQVAWETVEVVRSTPQERILERVVEQIVVVTVPPLPEDLVEVVKLVPQRIQQLHVEKLATLTSHKLRYPWFGRQRNTETMTK